MNILTRKSLLILILSLCLTLTISLLVFSVLSSGNIKTATLPKPNQQTTQGSDDSPLGIHTTVRPTNDLIETSWALKSIRNTTGQLIPTLNGVNIYIAFYTNQSFLIGGISCNNLEGDYQVDASGKNIQLDSIFRSTAMLCSPSKNAEDKDLAQQKADYFQTLELISSYEINGSNLLLKNKSGVILLEFVGGKY